MTLGRRPHLSEPHLARTAVYSMRGGHSAGKGVLGSLWTSRFLHVSRNYVFFEITEPKQKHQTHGSLDINVCDKALF